MGLTETPVGIPFPPPLLDLARATPHPQEIAPALLQGVVREREDCVKRGWAHRRAERDVVVSEALELARELAGMSPLAYGATKQGLTGPVADRMRAFVKDGAEAWGRTLAEPGNMAAVRAYFERVAGKR